MEYQNVQYPKYKLLMTTCLKNFSYSLLIVYHKTVRKSSVYRRFTVDYMTHVIQLK